MTPAEFIAKHGLTMTASATGSNPHMTDRTWKADHWKVTITREGNDTPMTTYFSTGIGHRKAGKLGNGVWLAPRPVAPSLATVLESLALDVSCGEYTFNDFCAELGYDTDSRKALDTYLAYQTIVSDLWRTLGYAAIADLQHVEW